MQAHLSAGGAGVGRHIGTFGLLFNKSGTWVAMTVVADRADNAQRLENLARKVAARM
ncbi:hypothetical protein [Streptomyces kebangsaanensis]|uniref:hypothetical protein n=1 Tax=Streptomyces kebangsaanensis TaxID=864058 RepID=UPI001F26C10D|nr:hypothetical protein [Streptomyces kebangsaanensis]